PAPPTPAQSSCRRPAGPACAPAPPPRRPPTPGAAGEWYGLNSPGSRSVRSPSHAPAPRAHARTPPARGSGADGAPAGATARRGAGRGATRRTVPTTVLPGILGARARFPPTTELAGTSTVVRDRARPLWFASGSFPYCRAL